MSDAVTSDPEPEACEKQPERRQGGGSSIEYPTAAFLKRSPPGEPAGVGDGVALGIVDGDALGVAEVVGWAVGEADGDGEAATGA